MFLASPHPSSRIEADSSGVSFWVTQVAGVLPMGYEYVSAWMIVEQTDAMIASAQSLS